MPTFISFLNWTDQGIRNVKDSPNRREAARQLLESMGGEMKTVYLTSGDQDLILIAEAPDGTVMAKFALAVAAQGNVRTRTVRAWTEDEFQDIIADLP